jgi:hypothetical protein
MTRHLSGTWVFPHEWSDGTNNFKQIRVMKTAEGNEYCEVYFPHPVYGYN